MPRVAKDQQGNQISHMGFKRKLAVGIVLLNLLVIGLAVFIIYEDRLEHVRRASTNVQNLSHLLANDVSSVFDRSDLVLRTVANEIEKQLKSGKIQRAQLEILLKQQHAILPEVLSLRVSDSQGVIRYGEGVPPDAKIDISDREHFILQRGNPKAGLIIGKPIVGRINREWVIPLTRRVNYPGGEFAGVVSVNIPVDFFVRQFAQLDVGTQGLIALRSDQHVSMARYPVQLEGGGAVGQFAISDQLRSLLKSKPKQVTYVAPSPSDSVERIFNYHRLGRYPLYVVSGLSMRDVLNEWKRGALQTVAAVVLFSVATLWFSFLLARAWRRQLEVSNTLRENEQRLGIALESGNFVVWDWEIDSGKVRLSKTSRLPFGCGDEESIKHIGQWQARIHPDDAEMVDEATRQHFHGKTEILEVEMRFRCADGSWRWLQIRGLVVNRSADGKPLRMIGLHADISERKSWEEELRLASTVFNLADVAMLVSNARNEIISVNPAFTTITGYLPEDVLGKNPRMFSAKTHGREFYQAMWGKLLQEGSWSGEVTNRKKDGEVFIEWLTIRRVFNNKGELTHHVAVFSDITQRKAAEARVQHLALHDVLTDLPNRSLLNERMEQAILRAKRDKFLLALMYFDLDKFKPVNDTYGHEVGDWLLRSVADRVLECVRESDTVARIGGDEFVVLLARIDSSKDALMVAEKIRLALCFPFIFAERQFEISSSIGMALYPEHGDNPRVLTSHADAAMYHAKKNGGNQVVLYQDGMQQA